MVTLEALNHSINLKARSISIGSLKSAVLSTDCKFCISQEGTLLSTFQNLLKKDITNMHFLCHFSIFSVAQCHVLVFIKLFFSRNPFLFVLNSMFKNVSAFTLCNSMYIESSKQSCFSSDYLVC